MNIRMKMGKKQNIQGAKKRREKQNSPTALNPLYFNQNKKHTKYIEIKNNKKSSILIIVENTTCVNYLCNSTKLRVFH